MKRSRQQRQQHITATAAQLFEEFGYASTSMGDIAHAVGLAKPSIYNYVDGKRDILYAIHEELIEFLMRRQESRQATPLSPSACVLEIIADIFELVHTHRGYLRVFFEHRRELAPEHQEITIRQRERYAEMVEDVIVQGAEQGEFRPNDARLSTMALFGMCNWSYNWYHHDGPLSHREIAYYVWSLFVGGLGSPEEASLEATRSTHSLLRVVDRGRSAADHGLGAS